MTSPEPAAAPPAAPARDPLIDALVRASFLITAVLTRVGADADLSLTQLRVMAILRDREVAMSALAAYLGLDRSTLSGLVGRAERRGLLQRTPHPTDRRGVQVRLTQDGQALAEHGAAEVERALSQFTQALTAADGRRLTGLLEQLLDSVEER